MRAEIKRYRDLGFSVFPLPYGQKTPAIQWSKYQTQHANNQQLERWFAVRSNVAIATGKVSGVVVVDCDSQAAKDYVYELGYPSPCPMAATARGYHLFFAYPDFEVGNRANIFKDDKHKVDVRGDGGYVVAAPSLHPDGLAYEWILHPADFPPPPMPAWLVDLLKPSAASHETNCLPCTNQFMSTGWIRNTRYAEVALERELADLRTAKQGNRNHRLNTAAYNLGQLVGNQEIDRVTVERSLLSVALSLGLSEIEAAKTIASGLKNGECDLRPSERQGRMANHASAPPAPRQRPTSAPMPASHPFADLVVNHAFISDAKLPNEGVLLVQSPTGTGKTELAKRKVAEIDNLLGEPARVLVITPRVSLTSTMSQRFDFENYAGLKGKDLRVISRLTITVNSLTKLVEVGKAIRSYDLVIIDEIEQLLDHMTNSTFEGVEAVNVHEVLRSIVASAKLVLCMDAHAGIVSLTWLKGIRRDVKFIYNAFQHERKQLTILPEYSAIIEQADKLIRANEGVIAIACGSVDLARKLHERYLTMLEPEQIRLVCSDNSMTKDTQAFLLRVNEELPKLKVFIYSPSIGTGVDITCPVRAVFGIFARNPLIASDMLQMLGRCRHAQEYFATLPTKPLEKPLETSGHNIASKYEKRALYTGKYCEQAIELHINRDGLRNISEPLKRLMALVGSVQANRNASMNDLMADFIKLASAKYAVKKQNAGRNDFIKHELKEAGERLHEKLRNLVFSVAPLSPDEHQELNGRGEADDRANAALLRYMIEDTYKTPVSDETWEHWQDGTGRAQLLNFCDLRTSRDKVLEADYKQIEEGHALHQRRHRAFKRALVLEAIKAVWGADGLANFSALREGVEPEKISAAMETYLAKNEQLLRLYFERRADRSDNSLDLLRWVLGRVGLRLEQIRNCKDAGKYRVTKDSLEQMVRLSDVRIQAKQRTNSGG